MAGSEVYTYNLAHELAKKNEIFVFTRIEDKNIPLHFVQNSIEDDIHICRINNYEPSPAQFTDKYLCSKVDEIFRKYLKIINPDVVHFGHLSHLSTQLPIIAKREFGLPTLFTIHDFWLFCHRGQMIHPKTMTICDLPNTWQCLECAQSHYKNPLFKRDWIEVREKHIKNVVDCIDTFLAPSHTLEQFFLNMGVDKSKILYSKYGFEMSRIQISPKSKGKALRFGFMGRVIYTKGVHILLSAFSKTHGDAELVLWGDVNSDYGQGLKAKYTDSRIKYKGAFHTEKLQSVIDSFDVLCCPSIWLENAPLVIQEAQAAHKPIITSDKGGMAELVHDGIDGFLFKLGDSESLREILQKIIDNPQLINKLQPSVEKVRSIKEDADFCMAEYKKLKNVSVKYPHLPVPWRMTFVTNPDKCNLHCKMCDTFSNANRHRLKEQHRLEMPFEYVQRCIEEFAPRGLKEIIPSTMGEPVLYKDFDRLVELCHLYQLKMNLTTNGTFPIKGVEYWTEKLLPIISDVKFSINAINPEINQSIMCGINTEKQIQNIEYWIEKRNAIAPQSTVTLQCTFMKSNISELTNLIAWGIEHGVNRIKGHHLWKTSDELECEMLRTIDNVRLWNETVEKCKAIAGNKIKLQNFEKIEKVDPLINTDDSKCPFLGQELWLEYDGSFQICCCPSDVRKVFGDFGNVQNFSALEMWNGDMYKNFIANWGEHENCKKCNMRIK